MGLTCLQLVMRTEVEERIKADFTKLEYLTLFLNIPFKFLDGSNKNVR